MEIGNFSLPDLNMSALFATSGFQEPCDGVDMLEPRKGRRKGKRSKR